MPDTYPIESFIPIPQKYAVKQRYPWKKLQVGQSFFVPSEFSAHDLEPLWNTLTSCRANAQRKTGFKFTMRQCREKGINGIRIWRIS